MLYKVTPMMPAPETAVNDPARSIAWRMNVRLSIARSWRAGADPGSLGAPGAVRGWLTDEIEPGRGALSSTLRRQVEGG